MSASRFLLKWKDGEYKVSEPNIGTMEVVDAVDFDELLDALEDLVKDMPSALDYEDAAVSKARALIAKHRGGK